MPKGLRRRRKVAWSVGRHLRQAALPGVQSLSIRHASGHVAAVFLREGLGDPRDACYLTCALEPGNGRVDVERTSGKVEWTTPDSWT